jgi:hypothetical protein
VVTDSERETKEDIVVQEIQVILPPDSDPTPVMKPKSKVFTVLKWFFGVVWLLAWAGWGIYFIAESESWFRWYIGLPMCALSPWWLIYDIWSLKKRG